MINTAKLKGRIVEKGFTIQTLAPKIPCTPYSLGQKILNNSPMTLAEAKCISEELNIVDDEFSDFFLNNELRNTTNN